MQYACGVEEIRQFRSVMIVRESHQGSFLFEMQSKKTQLTRPADITMIICTGPHSGCLQPYQVV
jgi:hypothetical protein